jgi:hypothetical protein
MHETEKSIFCRFITRSFFFPYIDFIINVGLDKIMQLLKISIQWVMGTTLK